MLWDMFLLVVDVLKDKENRGNALMINSTIPLSEMFGYTTTLRSSTQGRGTFTMTFDHYEPVQNLSKLKSLNNTIQH